MKPSRNRRDFLWTASLGASILTADRANASTLSSADDGSLRVALIGCGGRGLQVIQRFRENPGVSVLWVCDPDQERLAIAAKRLELNGEQTTGDMRRVLEDDRVTAVIIATPDHWHSPAAMMACDAGKHVYVEKPISHNVREGRLLVETAERNRVHVQHGTQCRSTSMMIEAIQLLRQGVIGDVVAAKCWNVQKRGLIGQGMETEPPPGLDYDTWVGPATMIPYRSNRVHNRWTWWYHFGTGDMGNDGVHDIDYTRWGLGVDTHPTRIVGIGGKYVHDDDKEFPDTQQVTFEYAGDGRTGSQKMLVYEQRLWSTNYPYNADSGAEFYGRSGQMFLSRRGKIQVLDEKNRPIEHNVSPRAQDEAAHVSNFIAAIRGESKLHADALTGHLSTSLCHLGNIATRVGRSLHFDGATERIIGDEEADRLLSREYRDHWARPRETVR